MTMPWPSRPGTGSRGWPRAISATRACRRSNTGCNSRGTAGPSNTSARCGAASGRERSRPAWLVDARADGVGPWLRRQCWRCWWHGRRRGCACSPITAARTRCRTCCCLMAAVRCWTPTVRLPCTLMRTPARSSCCAGVPGSRSVRMRSDVSACAPAMAWSRTSRPPSPWRGATTRWKPRSGRAGYGWPARLTVAGPTCSRASARPTVNTVG